MLVKIQYTLDLSQIDNESNRVVHADSNSEVLDAWHYDVKY
jgi:hypothetical protein